MLWLLVLARQQLYDGLVFLCGSTSAVSSQYTLSIYTPELLISRMLAAMTCIYAGQATGCCNAGRPQTKVCAAGQTLAHVLVRGG